MLPDVWLLTTNYMVTISLSQPVVNLCARYKLLKTAIAKPPPLCYTEQKRGPGGLCPAVKRPFGPAKPKPPPLRLE